MPTALPAMRGKFGSTEFYLITMPGKELAERLVIPKEMMNWEDLTIEERFQREVNFKRVRDHIAPYLAHDPDRFFGAFIVNILNPEGVKFESIEQIVSKLPTLYQDAAKQFGFLYLQGDEVLVPLDGQHRLAAIRFAISGKDERHKAIPGLHPNLDVARDACTVILIKDDVKKARKIFNKVNRYAKATSKADNLITADDDIVAVITREEVANNIVHERLVNYESNTLPPRAIEFTTLSTLYDATLAVLQELFGKLDTTRLPSAAEQKLYRTEAKRFWTTVMQKVKLFARAIKDPSETGDAQRVEIRRDYTLGKPIAQIALVQAILRLQAPDAAGNRLALDKICERINSVDWKVDNPLWQHVLMIGDRVVTGRQAAAFAARFIAYLLGEELQKKELEVLTEQYTNSFPDGHRPKGLPAPFYP